MIRLHRFLLALNFFLLWAIPAQSQTIKVTAGTEITAVYGLRYPENNISVGFLLRFNYNLPLHTQFDMAQRFSLSAMN